MKKLDCLLVFDNIFFPFQIQDLNKMLKAIDSEVLQHEDSTLNVYMLVQVIGFLINAVVLRNNEDLKRAGYKLVSFLNVKYFILLQVNEHFLFLLENISATSAKIWKNSKNGWNS